MQMKKLLFLILAGLGSFDGIAANAATISLKCDRYKDYYILAFESSGGDADVILHDDAEGDKRFIGTAKLTPGIATISFSEPKGSSVKLIHILNIDRSSLEFSGSKIMTSANFGDTNIPIDGTCKITKIPQKVNKF